jgi:hypothetical protein
MCSLLLQYGSDEFGQDSPRYTSPKTAGLYGDSYYIGEYCCLRPACVAAVWSGQLAGYSDAFGHIVETRDTGRLKWLVSVSAQATGVMYNRNVGPRSACSWKVCNCAHSRGSLCHCLAHTNTIQYNRRSCIVLRVPEMFFVEFIHLLGYYAAKGGLKPTCRDCLSVPSSRVRLPE